MRNLTSKEYITKARRVHPDRYDYSKVIYNAARSKVRISCAQHGEFQQTPNNQLNGRGVPYFAPRLCELKSNEEPIRHVVVAIGY